MFLGTNNKARCDKYNYAATFIARGVIETTLAFIFFTVFRYRYLHTHFYFQ